jgi:hypothetical protein
LHFNQTRKIAGRYAMVSTSAHWIADVILGNLAPRKSRPHVV